MKTKEQLLAFYGVEFGKTYTITKVHEERLKGYCGLKFKIRETRFALGGVDIVFDTKGWSSIMLLNICDYEEVKQPILDDKEREFLQKYVMNNPAFKGKVKFITRTYLRSKKAEYIEITTTKYDDDFGCFPCFEPDTMYKGMEIDKNYTPQELDLLEDCF